MLQKRKKDLQDTTLQLQTETNELRNEVDDWKKTANGLRHEVEEWKKTRQSFTDRIRRYKIQAEEWHQKRDAEKRSHDNCKYRYNLKKTKQKLYEDLMQAKKLLKERQDVCTVKQLKTDLHRKEVNQLSASPHTHTPPQTVSPHTSEK